MAKIIKNLWVAVAVLLMFALGGMLGDLNKIQQNVIRLHVVADSNSTEDQQVKLVVKDAVVAYLNENMPANGGIAEAKAYLIEQTQNITLLAQETLRANGFEDAVAVSVGQEAFGAREYETFSLPSGVYDSLRIKIGSGEGENWWCVVFPSLCLGASTEQFKSTAVSSGFDQGLTNTLAGDDGYEVRFFILDCLGKLENFLRFG